MFQKYLRGQVWVYTPEDEKESTYVQKGRRPCVIVSNDVANYHSNTVVVLPCTTAIKNDIPTHVHFKNVENGLVNVVMAEQIVTIDKRQIGEYVGMLDETTMSEIDTAMMLELGITDLFAVNKEDVVEKPTTDKVVYGKGKVVTDDALDYMRDFVETYINKGKTKTAELYGFTEETTKTYYYKYKKKLKEIDDGSCETVESAQE